MDKAIDPFQRSQSTVVDQRIRCERIQVSTALAFALAVKYCSFQCPLHEECPSQQSEQATHH